MPFATSLSMKAKKFSGVSFCTFAALCFLFLAACPRLAAQTSSAGVVLGTVTDASGGVLPGVAVDLTNVATNIAVHQTTNAKGQYLFPEVAAGMYTLTFKADRFRTTTLQNVTVEINKSFTGNIQMQVGEVSQTVEVRSTAQAELQTTDAQVGDVMSGQELEHLPTLQRNALELRQLQPGATEGGSDTGGTVTGARSDQNSVTLDGIDISDSIIGGQGSPEIEGQPANIENIQEFRTGVTNSNLTFDRSAGGQTALVSRSGSNAFHGDAYWYHQNSALNANTWDNNSVGVDRPELKDNRVGVSIGGPIIKDKTFFFSNYEVHRLPQVSTETALIPTPTLRAGTLQFQDATGATVQYPLASSMLCGSSGNSACDPRGLGISPTIAALWALMPPTGNDSQVGDGLNTTGFRYSVEDPVKDDQISFRLDHNFTDRLHFLGRYFYDRDLEPLPQFSIVDGKPSQVGNVPDRNDGAYGGLDYQISSNMTNSFRFGWIRSRSDVIGESGNQSAAQLNLAGTGTGNSSVPFASLQPAVAFLNTPIDNGQISRTQLLNGVTKQIVDNFFWSKGTHTFTFGGDIHFLPFLLSHTDTNNATTSPVALLDATSSEQTGSLPVPAADTPPTCGGAVTANCLQPTDLAEWDSLYLGALGIVNNVNVSGVRDGSLNALPLGTGINSNTTQHFVDFYFQDTWRMKPSFTLTYGLGYGWANSAKEADGVQSLLANHDAGDVLIEGPAYINSKETDAEQGMIFNPTLSYLPIRDTNRSSLFNTDYGDWAPRVSAAWNPTYDDGILGRLLGHGKTVIRGGFGIAYDRTNIVTDVIPSLLGIGFANTFITSQPLCNASSTPGANCNPAGADPGSSSFRIGQDGTVPLPAVTSTTSPIIVPPLGATDSIGIDPQDYKIGRNYMLDFTIQREIPGNMIVETGYIGRLGRDLPSGLDLDAAPYMFKDPASGQTFAQAFDNVGCVLRGEAGQKINSFTCPATMQDQPWFENQLPGLGALIGPGVSSTTAMVDELGPSITNGDVFTTFIDMDLAFRPALGLPSYNNLQLFAANLLETGTGFSNYNAFFATLHKRASHGLQFSLNYTLSKSLDQQGQIQNNAARLSTPFDPDLQYGPSLFDHPQVFNATYDYELPFGSGREFSSNSGVINKIIGGWYTAGIFSASSGSPVDVIQGANFGSALTAGETGSVGDIETASVSTGVHSGPNGSLNFFSNPMQAATSFRVPLLSADGRTGEANPLYGLGFWNFDMRLGKVTSIAEGIKVEFSADAFNLFNNVNFATPTLNVAAPAFGVLSSTQTLTNHTSSARYMQLGLRVEF
ncbi:MAG: carboxypeptidase-like regulatory domain-containing protein [Candidatus Acidiferrales bacterium]